MAVLLLPSATVTLRLLSPPKISAPIKPGIRPVLIPSKLASSRSSLRIGSVVCRALGEGSQQQPFDDDRTVYQGVYGPWTVDPSDVREVILYRSGLVTAAASFVIAGASAFLPEHTFLRDIVEQDIDLFYVLGAGGLGLSLFLIHIYVTPIKRTLQALWALGVLGSLGTYLNLAQPANETLTQYVVINPVAVWFVGPLFAALTGLVFKEGLCYGKLEAGVLTFIIPIVLLGHLSGLMDDSVKLSLLGVWMSLFVIFAARKFTQPIKVLDGSWMIHSLCSSNYTMLKSYGSYAQSIRYTWAPVFSFLNNVLLGSSIDALMENFANSSILERFIVGL